MSLGENRAIVGAGRQSAKGTPATITQFPRWGDGTEVQAATTFETIREGDGTASVKQLIKNLQYWKAKIVHGYARAIDLQFWLRGLFGTLSDNQVNNGVAGTAVIAAGNKSGTITGVAAGATSLTYALLTGAAPAINDWFQIGNDANAEVRQLSNVTGGGPYTLTVAALTNAHAAQAGGTTSVGLLATQVSKYGTIGAIAAGAVSASYTLVTGAGPVANDIFMLDVNNVGGNTTSEVVKLTSVSGAGPYTLNFAAVAFAHGATVPAVQVTAPYTHTFVPQLTREYHTLNLQYLLSVPESAVVQDAMIHSATLDGQHGKIIAITYEASGLLGSDSTVALTQSLDSSSDTLRFYGGTYNIDGSVVGAVAPFLNQVKCDYKHVLDESMQTEAVTLQDFVSTVREIDFTYSLLWQDFTQFKKAYLNAGTADSAIVGTGSLDVVWLAGGFDTGNSLELIASNLHYNAAQLPPPKLAGKALIQTVTAKAVVFPEVKAVLRNAAFGVAPS